MNVDIKEVDIENSPRIHRVARDNVLNKAIREGPKPHASPFELLPDDIVLKVCSSLDLMDNVRLSMVRLFYVLLSIVLPRN